MPNLNGMSCSPHHQIQPNHLQPRVQSMKTLIWRMKKCMHQVLRQVRAQGRGFELGDERARVPSWSTAGWPHRWRQSVLLGLKVTRVAFMAAVMAAIVERMPQVQGWGLGDKRWAWVSSQSAAGWPHWRLTSLLGLVAAVMVTMAVTMAQVSLKEENLL